MSHFFGRVPDKLQLYVRHPELRRALLERPKYLKNAEPIPPLPAPSAEELKAIGPSGWLVAVKNKLLPESTVSSIKALLRTPGEMDPKMVATTTTTEATSLENSSASSSEIKSALSRMKVSASEPPLFTPEQLKMQDRRTTIVGFLMAIPFMILIYWEQKFTSEGNRGQEFFPYLFALATGKEWKPLQIRNEEDDSKYYLSR